jgi:HEPN domain-containing protein
MKRRNSRDLASLLLEKASQDLAAVETLVAEARVVDEIFGFHAQQVAEKVLKAVLTIRGVRFRRTHDIAELVDRLTDTGLELPSWVEAVIELSPFGVDYRYQAPPIPEEPLDRERVAALVRQLLDWARNQDT